MRAYRLLCSFVVTAVLCCACVRATAAGWVFLGERSVRHVADHDAIPVTVARGGFLRMKIGVRFHAIRMVRVTVVYASGAPDHLETRFLIPAGGESRQIDLRGGRRAIRRIDFWYDTRSLAGSRALVRVYGLR